MDNPVLLPPAIDEVPPPGVAIVEELDKLLMVQLRDGRKVIGVLRSFDQFANLVLEGEKQLVTRACVCQHDPLHDPRSPPPPLRLPSLPPPGAKERIIVGTQYAEVPLGVHIIRGENVVLFGEVDAAREPPAGLTLVSEAEIKVAQKAEREAEKMKGLLRSRFDFLDGMD